MGKYFFVAGIYTSHPVRICGREVDLPMEWADGMAGVMPVFKTLEAAQEYADGKYSIYELEAE